MLQGAPRPIGAAVVSRARHCQSQGAPGLGQAGDDRPCGKRGTMSAKAETGIAMRIILPDAYRRMPWKNGAGTTTEIAIDPPEADVAGRFRWRLSIADV